MTSLAGLDSNGWAVLVAIAVAGFLLYRASGRWSPTWLYRIPAWRASNNPAEAVYRRSTGEVGERLYIGVADVGRLRIRHREHRGLRGEGCFPAKRKPWAGRAFWWLYLPARSDRKWSQRFITLELYWTRERAEAQETVAINRECPTYNIKDNQPRHRRQRPRRRTARVH